jgi:membrane protease YdiL (CAAX protease family)
LSGPDRPEPVSAGDEGAPAGVEGTVRPGSSIFTIEGRAAPGLFVVGWLATILGGIATIVGLAAAPSVAKVALVLGGLTTLAVGLLAGAGSQAMERRARGASFSGPSPFLAFAASVPIALVLSNLVALPFVALGLEAETPLTALITVAVTALVYLVIVRLLVVDHGALSWAEMGVRRPDGGAVAAFAGGALYAAPAVLATAGVVVALSGLLPLPPAPLPIGSDALGILANLLAAAVVAPLGEELFFRGYATTAWERGGGRRQALVRGALFFAFVHVLGVTGATASEAIGAATTGFLARLPIAFLLGWVFLRRRSLWASIGLHSTFNLVLVVLTIAGGELAGSGPALGW